MAERFRALCWTPRASRPMTPLARIHAFASGLSRVFLCSRLDRLTTAFGYRVYTGLFSPVLYQLSYLSVLLTIKEIMPK